MAKSNSKIQSLFLLLFLMTGFQIMSAQQISITGTVTDTTGEPLLGVSVTVPGTPTGVSTDLDGKFSINADAKGKLKFSYVGYQAVEEPINNRKVGLFRK